MNYLKEIREERKMTQSQLAEACGVIRQTISNIENNIANPSVDLAKKMGSVLSVPWTNFFRD